MTLSLCKLDVNRRFDSERWVGSELFVAVLDRSISAAQMLFSENHLILVSA